MDNFDDKHIDDFFRDGSEQHAFPYKESSWDKMELLIEKDKKKKAFGFYLLGFILLLALVSGLLHKNTSTESKTEAVPQTEIAETSNAIKTNHKSQVLNKNTAKKQSLVQKEKLLNTTKKEIVKKKPTTSSAQKQNLTLASNEKDSNDLQKKVKKAIAQDISMNKNNSRDDSRDDLNTTIIEKEPIADNKNFDTPSLAALNGISLKAFEEKVPLFKNTSVSFNDIKITNSHFALAIVGGMEYSSVGLMNKSKAGYRLGAEISYQFKNKFEIGSGMIISQKKYITESKNYSFSEAGLMDDIMPEMVHGKCDVIEIPVEFSYYLNSYDKSTFYFSLGASTFLMRKEWYDFEYEKMYDEMDELPRYSADNGINKHLFGVGTIAVGYQKNINKRMAFQLEPYFQIPFTGIGMGQVNLVSGGLQFRVLFKK